MKTTDKNKALADLLFPKVKAWIPKAPTRKRPAFRIAPSPTGQMHIGTVGMALCDMMLAKSMKGKSYIRIEDTDHKREVHGVAGQMAGIFKAYGIKFNNRPVYQSKRMRIYHTFAKFLVERGRAYPCFCTEEDLTKMREAQERRKQPTGYYGEYARCKNLPLEEIQKRIRAGEDWALRVILPAAADRVNFRDLIKGDMSLPAVINNPVILKSNGMPPYNLACAADDTLMNITHVLRGEEWLPSAAEHIQLYAALEIQPPNFAHLPVICVLDNGNKRKLSKRKDRQALAQSFLDDGYPADALVEYLLTIFNTDYELWRGANPKKHWRDFHFRFEKIGSNSPLFDWDKLNDISKNIIADMSRRRVNRAVKHYFARRAAREPEFKHPTPDQMKKIFTLLAVDRGTDRPRKDIAKFSDILTEFDYLFWPVKMTPMLEKYKQLLPRVRNRDAWFALVKEKAPEFGFKNVREFTQAIRVALTGREHSTDLYTISKLLLGNL
jgi:glutamyl-tRNA synthetase